MDKADNGGGGGLCQAIDIRLIDTNNGQIKGLPANPRTITREKMKLLEQSLTQSPEFLQHRPLLVYPYDGRYIVMGGNMRLQALRRLKWQTVPCTVIDAATPVDKLREYTIKDNADFGKWDFEQLANLWEPIELQEWGVDIPQIDLDEPKESSNAADPILRIKFADISDYSRVIIALTEIDEDMSKAILKLIDK